MSPNGDSSRSSEPAANGWRARAQPAQFSAAPLSISEALSWEFVRQDGWRPNCLLTPSGRKVSLLSIMALLVAQPDERTLLLDDGSGVMSARLMGGGTSAFSVGDVLSVRARLGEANGERFLIAEAARSLRSQAWLAVRRIELRLRGDVGEEKEPQAETSNGEKGEEETQEAAEERLPPGSPAERLYAIIKALDEGAGVEMTALLDHASSDGIADAEALIQSLLERGEIFVPRPGILKALE